MTYKIITTIDESVEFEVFLPSGQLLFWTIMPERVTAFIVTTLLKDETTSFYFETQNITLTSQELLETTIRDCSTKISSILAETV